jgi:hypothetical protein
VPEFIELEEAYPEVLCLLVDATKESEEGGKGKMM